MASLLNDWLTRLGDSHVWPYVGLFGLAFGASLLVGLVNGIPVPSAHDEFAYLLAADTFASGRLANPTHLLWPFFETFHVIHEPSYVAKYPPAQGLVLGFGQWISGTPILGAWLTAGLLAAVTYWMALGWIPRPWALLAALLSTIQLAGPSYWAQSYWGGNMAAIGGALVLGAAPRIVRSPSPGVGVAAGAGLTLLALSRPFEGLLTATAMAGFVWLRMGRSDSAGWSACFRRAVPAAAVVLLAGGTWLGFYNQRTVGDPLKLPYQVHEETYSMSSLKPWKTVEAPPAYRHRVLAQFHHMEKEGRARTQTPGMIVKQAPLKAGAMGIFFLGFFGLPALVGLPGAMKEDKGLVVLAATGGLVLLASMWTIAFAHYLAPVAPLLYVLLAASVASLAGRSVQSRTARWTLNLVAMLFVGVVGLRLAFTFVPVSEETFGVQRARVADSLADRPGRDLVFVQYTRAHTVHNEWVYNAADIDGSEVVWARDMGPDANRELLRYYPDRRPWLLLVGHEDQMVEPDQAEPVRLMDYPAAALAGVVE